MTDITISCPSNNLFNLVLHHTGVLTLQKNCKLYTSSTTLISDNTNYESSYQAVIPDFDIQLDDCCENKSKPIINTIASIKLTPFKAVNLDKDSLNLISKKLDDINEIAEELSETKSEPIYHNSYFVYSLCSFLNT